MLAGTAAWARGAECLSVGVILAASACGGYRPVSPESEVVEAPTLRLIATERSNRGARLVLLSEDGRRMANLTRTGEVPSVDTHASFHPDGGYLVFASSRERTLSESSLWLMQARYDAEPLRLTTGRAVDRDPVWSKDGKAVYYSSNAKGSFDIWRLAMRFEGEFLVPSGAPVQVTSGPGDELGVSVAPDGSTIVYSVTDRSDGSSYLEVMTLADGEVEKLTTGPLALTPAWSPDGKTIAFAGPVKGRDDTDILLVEADGSGLRSFLSEPYADQTAPVWSADGEFLFATAVYRSVADGAPVLSSVVVSSVERARWRALHDPSAVDSRWGIAVRGPVEAGALLANPDYVAALRRAVEQQLNRLEL